MEWVFVVVIVVVVDVASEVGAMLVSDVVCVVSIRSVSIGSELWHVISTVSDDSIVVSAGNSEVTGGSWVYSVEQAENSKTADNNSDKRFFFFIAKPPVY